MNYWITIHWPPFEDELNRIPELELKYDPLDLGFENQLIRGDWVYVYRTIDNLQFLQITDGCN